MDSDDIQSINSQLSQSHHRRTKRSRMNSQSQHSPRLINVDSPVDELVNLANLNPQLMTERQQLTFLLRQTAPVKPEGSTSSSEDHVSSDEENHNSGGNQHTHKHLTKKTERERENMDTNNECTNRKRRHDNVIMPEHFAEATDKHRERRSPRSPRIVDIKMQFSVGVSSSDKEVEYREGGCAVCGSNNAPDTLMLCKSCDEKYPTQEALHSTELTVK